MAKQQRTWGIFIIQLALAIYFVITGLCLVAPKLGRNISASEIEALTRIFNNATVTTIVDMVIGILLLVCGACFCIKAFGMDLGKFDDCVKYITLIVWIVVTVVALIYYFKDFKNGNAMHWFLSLAKNCLIIGGVLTVKNGK